MNHLDMCSGIGGWAIAFRELGINTIAFCEIEKYPQQVLQKNFPGVPIFNDLKELTYEDIKERTGVDSVDIITCSYPCQPFSVAGKQKGEEDSRHLWPDTFRIVQECRPTWFVGENVSGHIKLGLDTVLQDLASEGYDTRTFIIPASSVGAWHKRERLWVIGYKAVSDTDSRMRGRRRTEQQSRAYPQWQFYSEEEEQTRQHIRSEVERCDVVPRETENVSDTKSHSSHDRELGHSKETSSEERHKRKTGGNRSNDVSDTDIQGSQGRIPRGQNQEWESELGHAGCSSTAHLQQRENWWQTQSELCGVPDGVSHGLDKGRVGRIKGLGNAIVPQIAWFIGNAIISAQNTQKDS